MEKNVTMIDGIKFVLPDGYSIDFDTETKTAVIDKILVEPVKDDNEVVTVDSNGNYHSYDDQPAIIRDNGKTRFWYRNGVIHREDGPAVIWADGTQDWMIDGLYHREDGAARIFPDGQESYAYGGLFYSYDNWCKINDFIESRYRMYRPLEGEELKYSNPDYPNPDHRPDDFLSERAKDFGDHQ